jgi:hypothetical protein
MNRSSLRAAAIAGAIACLASGAHAADPQPTMPALANETMVQQPAARPASVEVFSAAPLPNENMATPTTRVADADQPNLHPDLLSMHENASGALSDTSVEYQRTQRVRPAGGMSLSIPMQ